MIIPKSNISVIDVINATGYNSVDVGWLCGLGEPYINKWAKYKPVIHNCFGSGVDYYPNDWWKSTYGNCGITYSVYNILDELYDAYEKADTNALDVYRYQNPPGGRDSPFRLGDFAGYDSKATPPIVMGMTPGTVIINNNNPELSRLRFSAFAKVPNEDELTAENIFGNNFIIGGLFKPCFGVAFRDAYSKGPWNYASTVILQNQTVIEQIGRNGLTSGRTYEFISFLTDTDTRGVFYSTQNATGPTKLVPLPKNDNLFPYIQTFDVETSGEATEDEELKNRRITVRGSFNRELIGSTVHWDYTKANIKVNCGCDESTWVITGLSVAAEFMDGSKVFDRSNITIINKRVPSEAVTIKPHSFKEFNEVLFNRRTASGMLCKNIKLTVYVNGVIGGTSSIFAMGN